MQIGDKEAFVRILSDARKNSSQNAKVYRQLSEAAENSKLKRVLEKLAFVTENDVKSVDHCFEKIGEKPCGARFRLEDVLAPDVVAPDFKKNLAQVRTSTARELYILVKATELALHSLTEYPMLISAAEVMGYHEVSAVLETILEHRLTFMEQDRRLVRDIIESNLAETGRLASLQSAA